MSFPPEFTRGAVVFIVFSTSIISFAFAFERRVLKSPLRVARDEEGVVRWLTREDIHSSSAENNNSKPTTITSDELGLK